MAINNFVLDLLGVTFTITVDEETEYLEEILAQYRTAVENTKEIFKLKDPLTAAILTGFIVSEELHRIKTQIQGSEIQNENEAREAEEVTNKIIERINSVLEDSSSE